MKKENFEFEIAVKGKKITEYHHEGRTFIEGRKGSNFTLELYNDLPYRILAIPSVDGLNTIDGIVATSFGKGYIVERKSRLIIPGWTVDSDNVASFEFQSKESSYAELSAKTRSLNVGVLGFQIYAEKYQPLNSINISTQLPYYGSNIFNTTFNSDQLNSRGLQNSTGMKTASASSVAAPTTTNVNSLGTGFGKAMNFPIKHQTFLRGNKITELIIYYDNRKGLLERGIDISKRKINLHLPKAFQDVGCTPPPGWEFK